MGSCCTSASRAGQAQHEEACHGHHSVFIHPEGALSDTNCNVVYRPPHLNQRLAPGTAKPRFWLSPHEESQSPAVVSVAWCERCQSKQGNLPRLTNTRRSKRVLSGGGKVPHSLVEEELQHSDDRLMAGDSDYFIVKAYPAFLMPFVDKVLRLRLVFMDPKVEQLVGEYGHLKHNEEEQEPMLETAYLVRSVHSLRLHMGYSTAIRGLPEVSVDENHGGVKRLKKVRYRSMPVRWIDLDHRKPSVTIVGEAFQLTLARPCPDLCPEDFHDSNGETPAALGTYTRALDSCPEKKLKFSVRLYHWFSQPVDVECDSDVIHRERFLESVLDV